MTKISPQGYIYGDDPQAENPFWGEGKKDAVIEPLTVKSANTEQTFQATEGIDGYAPITVQPVVLTNRSGVDPSVDGVRLTPTEGSDGFKIVHINPIRSYMIPNLYPQNVKSGVQILDTLGTYSGESSGSETRPATLFILYNDEFANDINLGQVQHIYGDFSYGIYTVCSITNEEKNEQQKTYSSVNMDLSENDIFSIELSIRQGTPSVQTVNNFGSLNITLKVQPLHEPQIYETKYYNNDGVLSDMTIILCNTYNRIQLQDKAMLVFAGNT